MRFNKSVLVASLLVGAAACGDRTPPLQQAARPADVAWLDSLIAQQPAPGAVAASPQELGLVADSAKALAKITAEPKEERSTRPAPTRRTATARRSRSSSGGSSGTYASAPAPQRTVVKRNTTRDAAIGAAGGAVVGAVAGGRRHRVRGAVVGAVVGGAAGAVIGSTVDVQRRPAP